MGGQSESERSFAGDLSGGAHAEAPSGNSHIGLGVSGRMNVGRFSRRACLPSGKLAAMLLLILVCSVPTIAAPADEESARALHALNRLGYGPRPGEVERVAAEGVEAWIHRQLDPASIADPAAAAAVAALPKLKLDSAELLRIYQAEIRERQGMQRAKANGNTEEFERLRAQMREREPVVVAQALGELQHAKLARAVLSERQLQEVLTDFWFNYFNVDARKQQVRALVSGYEKEAIRPHVFGTFRDLLGATAKSPAMLVYLDNWRSSRAYELGAREKGMIERQRKAAFGDAAPAEPVPTRRGLNENYARELLELHTLGVDGGYTQKDVQELARILTGWTVDLRAGKFTFRRAWHDDGKKTLLGKTFPAGGAQAEGEKALDLLASHPATARRVATRLCQRFVTDEPPADLVERVAKVFAKSGGDLRATYGSLFLSPDFFAPEYRGAKIKSPFEFAVSALRASDATLVPVKSPRARLPITALEAGALFGRGEEAINALKRRTVLLHLLEMGQPLYAWAPPTGFPEQSAHWVGSGALIARLNFALALTSGQVADAKIDVHPMLEGAQPEEPGPLAATIARRVLGSEPAPATLRVMLDQSASADGMTGSTAGAQRLLALALGSPEFQRR